MNKYISTIIEIIVYLLKVFLIITIVFVSVGFVYGLSKYNNNSHTALDSPLVSALLCAYIYTRFNIIVFVLLLFYKFNKYEIIGETISYSIIAYFLEGFIDLFYLALLMTVFMFLYLLIKQCYLKHVNNNNKAILSK